MIKDRYLGIVDDYSGNLRLASIYDERDILDFQSLAHARRYMTALASSNGWAFGNDSLARDLNGNFAGDFYGAAIAEPVLTLYAYPRDLLAADAWEALTRCTGDPYPDYQLTYNRAHHGVHVEVC
jgi:hypothetical protein